MSLLGRGGDVLASKENTIERFSIAIENAVLVDLRERLKRTRLPDAIPDTGWDYGVDVAYLRNLIDYWRDSYDWRKQEEELNRLDHFRTLIDGQSIHFAHIRSRHPNATPVIMVHGWPGSIVEFLDVIGPLTAPEEHGGRVEDACHLVIPSLPGYGFSEPTRSRGWSWQRRAASAYVELMARLGYSRYVAQGGDWGAIVTAEMALLDPEHMIGLHTNMPLAAPLAEPIALTEQEQADVGEMARWNAVESAYAMLNATKPQSIGVALNDSPAGLCGWIIEKFHSWTDAGLDSTINRDRLLTNIMLYWVTGTAASAARFYYEFFRMLSGEFDPETTVKLHGPITVPTAVARFPKEITRPPRAWIEKRFNLVRWTEMERGGHFAAMEQPKIFADDLRAFIGWLRAH